MRRIEEVEMATSLDDLKTSPSMFGNPSPNFETLDANISSSLKEIFQNLHFRERVCLHEQNAQKR